MIRAILCTKPDGGVGVIRPAAWAYMRTHGGIFVRDERGIQRPWNSIFSAQHEVDKMIANGRRASFARRWIMTAIVGGMTDAEFYAAIIEKDMPKGWTAPELVEPDEISILGRWFRDAWRRSHNGGPISVNLETAKRIHARRIDQAHSTATEAHKRQRGLSLLERNLGSAALPRLPDIRPAIKAIASARQVEELYSIWPRGLTVPDIKPSAPVGAA